MTEPERSPGDRLTQRAAELERLRDSIEHTTFADDQTDATGEITTVDNHPADVSDFTFQRELDDTVEHILDQEAQQVRQAMQARAEGRYGICEDCGRPISKERLEARPEATRCVDCQRAREAAQPAT